jgi:tripartite-type tricarboxylate transporter receptor subunit TctC
MRFLLAAAAAVLAVQAHAQFPNRPITIVIPLAAGDAADTAARVMGEELTRTLKQPVVAVNRPGAGGVVAADSVIKAPKDGYTILFAQNSALTFRPVTERQSTPYEPERDLVPLGLASRTPSVLVVPANAPYRDLASLIEQARAKPDSVRVGTPGEGSVADFCVQLVNVLAGVKLTSVPFKGAAPSIAALRGGHIEGVATALGAVSSHLKSGAFRAVAISRRFPELADVPTLKELGHKQDMFGIWFAFLAAAGIPEEARRALVAGIEQAVKSPGVGAKLLPLGIVQDYRAPAELAAEMREESELVRTVAKASGLLK